MAATATVLTKSTTTTLEDHKEEDTYTSLENIGLPWLYFGDKTMAKDMHNLRQHHIRYILNCTPTKTEGGIPNYYTTTTSSVNAGINKRSLGGMFEYCRIPMQDNATESLSIWYDTAWNFIDRCRIREDGNILVHCNWGQSRSVSIIISYLIKYYRYTYDDALEAVQKARPEASPNQSFEKQLIKLSKELQITKDYVSISPTYNKQRVGPVTMDGYHKRQRISSTNLPLKRRVVGPAALPSKPSST